MKRYQGLDSIRVVFTSVKSILVKTKYNASVDSVTLTIPAVIFFSSGSSIRPVARISFVMDQQKVFSKINIVNRKNLKYQMIVGRRDLKRFLVEV